MFRPRLASTLLYTFFIQQITFPQAAFADEQLELLTVAGSGDVLLPIESGSTLSLSGASLSVSAELQTGSGDAVEGFDIPAPSDPPSTQSFSASVVISEVMWMGSDRSTADEWIELTGFANQDGPSMPRSLSGWTITQQKEGAEVILARFPAGSFLASGGVLVVSNYTSKESRLFADPYLHTTSMSIPNTKLLLRLRDQSGSLIDEVDDAIGAPFAGSNASGFPKASMERMDLRSPGTRKENWTSAERSIGWDEGGAIFGTPGFRREAEEPSVATLDSVEEIIEQKIDTVIQLQPCIKTKISEILPDSKGSDEQEWIEMMNEETVPCTYAGLTLQIGTSSYAVDPQLFSPIGSGSLAFIPKSVSRLSLPNAGGTVMLLLHDTIIDSLTYQNATEGISIGRLNPDASESFFCIPSPGAPNVARSMDARIQIESGLQSGTELLTVNVMASTLSGSLAGASCRWDFGDGFSFEGCNPGPHRFLTTGELQVRLNVTDYCGTTVEHSLPFSIARKPSTSFGSSDASVPSCIPTTFSGVTISEFLPNPEADEEAGEWIELRNETNDDRSLCGWSVDDQVGQSDPYQLDRMVIRAHEHLLLPRGDSKIALNNDSDTVRLIAPLPGAGTGVLMSIAYSDPPEGSSFAFRDDGHWLWSPHPTPGSKNIFQELEDRPIASPIILSAALPNPQGIDEDYEWIEITNKTVRPQWLHGWKIRVEGRDDVLPLDGMVLAKIETLRLWLKPNFPLPNSKGTLQLFDPKGQLRSVLSWENVKEDQIISREPAILRKGIKIQHIQNEGQKILAHTQEEVFELRGISLPSDDFSFHKIESINLIKALIKKKIVDLEFYSNNAHSGGYIHIEGADLGAYLLAAGLAYVPGDEECNRLLEYEAYEREAQMNLRGLWALADAENLIRVAKENELLVHRYHEEGLQLQFSDNSELVESGSTLSLSTNLPAQVFVSLNSGSFIPLSESLVLHDDTLITAYAEFPHPQKKNEAVRSIVVQREYIIQREHYPHCLLLDEVYPSPLKGEIEWVEIRNVCLEEASMLGFSIDDQEGAGSKPMTIDSNIRLKSLHSYILSGSLLALALNNNGDSVILRDPNQKVMDVIHYPSIKKGLAYARREEEFCLSATSTPGTANVCELPSKKIARAVARGKKVLIGVKTKYAFRTESTDPKIMNTKNDQNLSQLEGLIYNSSTIDSSDTFHLYFVAMFILIVAITFFLYGKTSFSHILHKYIKSV